MDDFIPPQGVLTARGLSREEASDVAHAENVVRDVGHHDIGQVGS